MQLSQAKFDAFTQGFKVLYLAAMHAAKPMWAQVAMRSPSNSAKETYGWLNAVPGMRKLIGEIQLKNLSLSDYTIVNDEWEDTVTVKQADMERDNVGFYSPLFSALGAAAAEHPDELIASLLINGFTNKCYTGKNFFDTDHEPVAGKTKFSNKGTKKFSQANYRTARQNLKSRLNTEGRPMNLGAKLLLVVSPTYETTAREVLVADRHAAGASNVDEGTADLLVWPRLAADEHKWFLLDVGQPLMPLILQMEREAALTAVNKLDDSYVVLNHKFIFQAYGRYGAGYGLPQLAYGSTGADAA